MLADSDRGGVVLTPPLLPCGWVRPAGRIDAGSAVVSSPLAAFRVILAGIASRQVGRAPPCPSWYERPGLVDGIERLPGSGACLSNRAARHLVGSVPPRRMKRVLPVCSAMDVRRFHFLVKHDEWPGDARLHQAAHRAGTCGPKLELALRGEWDSPVDPERPKEREV